MKRSTLTYLITALLLLMNIQAAMSDAGEVFHQDSVLETVLSEDTTVQVNDTDEDTHCHHCCHTHASNVMVHESLTHQLVSVKTQLYYQIGKSNPASAPPTPPPNA